MPTIFLPGTPSPEADIRFNFDNTYASVLSAGVFFEHWTPAGASRPQLLYFNTGLAQQLGIADLPANPGVPQSSTSTVSAVNVVPDADTLAQIFSGNTLPDGAQPIAQAYAGHQFGHFSPQLGDGRALLVGELLDRQGQRRDLAFKGSGRTPFSRGGDGKAAVGPMLREVLVGECMHALGIPTTRALAVVATGEAVFREQALPGAVLTRIASSHLRVGTFEFFSARRMTAALKQLFDYTVARHDPQLPDDADRPIAFFNAVCGRQAALIADWTAAGFIHGVMNTDNMALSGETIDYGPCAFMEAYDPATKFSSIDQHGRYAFGNQPGIAQWNLARLAECLLPLLPDEDEGVRVLSQALDAFPALYRQQWLIRAAAKLGVNLDPAKDADALEKLLSDWLSLLQSHAVDWTWGWRYLCDAAQGDESRLPDLFSKSGIRDGGDLPELSAWLARWRVHLADEPQAVAQRMRGVNPWMIARNAAVEHALTAASAQGDLAPLNRLLTALRKPFEEDVSFADLAAPAPREQAVCYKTFCGT